MNTGNRPEFAGDYASRCACGEWIILGQSYYDKKGGEYWCCRECYEEHKDEPCRIRTFDPQ